jgi:hypothetical protein
MDAKHFTVPKWWDQTIDGDDGLPLLLIKKLFSFMGRGVWLHKIVWPDPWERFHTHPASWAVRIILWGGYVEEMHDGTMRYWRPGSIGIVRHDDCHRINRLLRERPSYSLWIRGKRRHPIYLKGDAWPVEIRNRGIT